MADAARPTLRGDIWDRFRALSRWSQAAIWLVAWPVPLAFLAMRNPPSRYLGLWRTLAVVAAVAWLGSAVAVVGGDSPTDDGEAVRSTTTSERIASTTTSVAPGASSPTTAPVAPEGGTRTGDDDVTDVPEEDHFERGLETDGLLLLLAALTVEAEHDRTGYDRELFPHWDDGDGDGCDTRCEVLSAQRSADGSWFSEWDGATEVDSSLVHVDHVVALSEAWDSGADLWSAQRRDEFADDTANLLAVTAASNVRKSDRDAAEWFPSRSAANCLWASTVVRVKSEWDLAVDPAERDALGNLLGTCDDAPARSSTTAAVPGTTAAPPTTSPSGGGCDPAYPDVCIPSPPPDLDCGDIPHRRFRVLPPDPHGFDGNDDDGIGCES